jgi:hypothetical protein
LENKQVDRFLSFFGEHPFSVIFTNIFSVIFSGVIFWLCFEVSDDPTQEIFNILLVIIGALIGWALGMFFAPYSENEAARFSSIGQAVSAFASGYVISKLDRFLEATMFQESEPITIVWVRLGLMFCSLLLVMLTVFSNRAYFRANNNKPSPD